MNKPEQWLEDHAQAFFNHKIECLKWFVEDYGDISLLYSMIEENFGLDEWFAIQSNTTVGRRIIEYNKTYYILEEEDYKKWRDIYE